MKKRYFDDKKLELKAELDSWLGTPYRHFCGIKGKGADCIHYVVRVIEKLGANQGRNLIIPNYVKDWNLHRGEELLIEHIEKQLFSEKIGYRNEKGFLIFSENIDDGDIVLFKFGRLSGHCGIYYQKQVYQTLNPSGIERVSFFSKNFMDRITTVYKIYRVD